MSSKSQKSEVQGPQIKVDNQSIDESVSNIIFGSVSMQTSETNNYSLY